MIGESKSALVDKFVETANLNYYMFKYSIERAEEGAKSLSSRTMIRKAIAEYLDGERSLEELKAYTEDKYIDGVESLDNITYAERIVGEESIAKYNKANLPIPEYNLKQSSSDDSITIYLDETKSMVLIYSPIIDDRGVMAYDYLVYMIKNELDSLSTKVIKTGLICDKKHINLFENSKIVELEDDRYILETETDFYALYEMKGKYFYTKINKSDLFNHLNIVVSRIFIGSIIIFIIASVFIYTFIIRYAKNKIKNLDESREEFKRLAYFDQLTGAYSRSFLEVWDKNYREKNKLYSIVMIDVNDFKKINDTYGHSEGDLVLKEVAKTIMSELRDTDILVRFGGDEFLLILPYSNIGETKKIMEKIEKQLYSMESVSVPVTISFGISSFIEESYEEAIKVIDKLMYKDKKRNKNILTHK
jgi:diguanylate cyclase (GGDEF)-like protein